MYVRRNALLPTFLAAVFSNFLACSLLAAGSPNASLSYVRLPLVFEENRGQARREVRFVARGAGYGLYLRADSAMLTVAGETLQLHLEDSDSHAAILAGQLLPGRSNYLYGNDPSKWITGVKQYSSVTYAQVYPGIDLVYHGDNESGGRLEYDFLVAPGADPSRILLSFDSSSHASLRLARGGDLLLAASHSTLTQLRPRVYQVIGGRQREISGRYVLAGDRKARFKLGAYDHAVPLVIDPVLLYGTVIPGSGNDAGLAVITDAAGSAYVTGYTSSSDFLNASPMQSSLGGGKDVFVSKVNAAGTALVFSTYIGGGSDEQGQGIAVDASGEVIVAGWTSSTNFPTQGPLQSSLLGIRNAFVLKLNPTGSFLACSTYLGGSGTDQANAIALDPTGAMYITGSTNSPNFPAISALHGSLASTGATNAFIAKLNPSCSSIIYSTYLGGSGVDSGAAIAVDSSNNVVIAGSTTSSNFPTVNPIQSSYAGSGDAFISKLNAAGTALLFSTYYGGSGQDNGYGVALDPSGNIYVSGFTNAISSFPTVNAMPAPPVAASGFLLKLSAAGTTVFYSTIINDSGCGVAVDSYGNAYISYISRVNASGTALDYSVALSGTIPKAIAVDPSGNVYVTGYGATLVSPLAQPKNFFNVSLVKEGEPSGGPHAGYITPAVGVAGSGATTVRIIGTGFVSGATVTRNGVARSATFVSPSEVDVTLTSGDLASTGSATLLVTNPSSSTPSNPVVFTVQTPAVTISSLSPSTVTAGAVAFTLSVTGTGFVPGSTVQWNGSALSTTFVSSTQLTASVQAANIGTAGIVPVQVQVTGGTLSASSSFTVSNPAPAITTLSPNSAATGSAAFTLTVTGMNFTASSVVQWNGTARSTTFTSKTQLQASINSTDVAAAASNSVTVFTPTPGGGTSPAVAFAVAGPNAPTISSISPANVYAASGAFTLTVTGNGFLNTSVVAWNGANLSTTFVSATQLTAAVPAININATGTASITVVNPAGSGGTSAGVSFTIAANPAPGISSITPSTAAANSGAFTLTVNGTGFEASSQAQWNGASRATNFINATQLTVSVLSGDLVSTGTASVTVVNPAPGGGTSVVASFTITANPTPSVASILPATANAASGAFTLTVTGSGFIGASQVQWNGVARQTTYVSATQLTAAIQAADVGAAGTASVTVANPSPGGGTSGPQTFTISNPVPGASGVSPQSTPAGSPGFTLIVNGSGFVSGSQVQWNGVARATTFTNATQLSATISAADVLTGGTATVSVVNPTPGGGTSGSVSFSIIANPAPMVASILPASATLQSGAFTLTVTGSGFLPASQVQWSGVARNTTYVSGTQLTASIQSSDVLTAGTVAVTVMNPPPGGGTSPSANFTVNNPAPAITQISPASLTAGSTGFTLTVTGTGFVNGSQVQWNGVSRATTFGNSTQLTATISSADLSAPGAAAVTVVNPTPGGGTAGSEAFTITANPMPLLTAIQPVSAAVNSGAFTLTLNGSGFVNGSQVQWNGVSRSTTFVNSTQLTAAIQAADLASTGAVSVTVVNPAPGGGVSGSVSFAITANPLPAIASILPSTATAGASATTVTITGTGFVAASQAQWGGTGISTTFVSNTQLTATIPSASLATAGTFAITVTNPAPGGGTSASATFTVNNPAPSITGLPFSSIAAGSPATTLTVNGSGFVAGSQVQWNGSSLATSFVNSTQLTALMTANILAAGSSVAITVQSPTPGGGASNTVTFTVSANPMPAIASIVPSSATINSTAFTLTVTGSGFITSSQVQWNGLARNTTYVSPTQLTAAINATDLLTASVAAVTVVSPAPAGGTSANANFTVGNPPPTATVISPATAAAGSSAFTLTVTGTGFLSTSQVQWNGANRITNVASSTQLTALITAGDLTTSGTATVTVVNPTPGGGVSGALSFAITANPAPVASVMQPSSAAYNGGAFMLSVTGSGFVSASQVQWNGVARNTTYVSATQLTATINASDLMSPGTAAVTVMNPTPGGGISSGLSFTIGNPAPSIASLSPATVTAGSATFTLTVTGIGFVNGSQILVNGVSRTTTYASATQLTTAINASDITAAGTLAIAVTTPSPGGGTSSGATLTVSGNPLPSLAALWPASASIGSGSFTLAVVGAGFTTQSVAQWNGVNRVTTFVSTTEVTVAILATDLNTAGQALVTVTNPTPGGGTSGPDIFTITGALNPVPAIATLSPASATVNTGAFTLTVNGSDFNTSSQVQWNGVNLTTNFVGATQLTAAVPAGDPSTTGTAAVTVVNPLPGGGTSNTASFAINLLCSYTLTPPSTVFPATASTGSVAVAVAPGCVWSAASLNAYLTITSNVSGSGNGTVSFALTADTSSARTGTLVIAGQNVTISQNGTVQGVVSPAPSGDTAGGTVRIPITLVANTGVSADKIAFSIQVTPDGVAPALTGTLAFTPDAALGPATTVDTSGGAGMISLSWLTPASTVSGTQNLGTLLVTTPSSAAVGQTYTVQVTGATASYQASSVALAGGGSASLAIRLDYMVGDNYPFTANTVGNFGDNTLNTLDLVYLLRAATNLAGFVPPTCSDRFDAMDAFPADTATTRGGDGVLNTLDLVALLQRVTNIDTSSPRRVSRGLTCSGTVGAQSRTLPRAVAGAIQIVDGSVFLTSEEDLSLDGLALSLAGNSSSEITWTAASGVNPNLVDTEIPGTIALAWMEKLEVRKGRRLLLGTASGAPNFALTGTSAHSGSEEVRLASDSRESR